MRKNEKLIISLARCLVSAEKKKKGKKEVKKEKVNEKSLTKYRGLFGKLKEHLEKPGVTYKSLVDDFKQVKNYVDPETNWTESWVDNVLDRKLKFRFDQGEYTRVLDDYQNHMAEKNKRTEDPSFLIEDSNELRCLKSMRDLSKSVERKSYTTQGDIDFTDINASIEHLLSHDLLRASWFYIPEGLSDILYFWDYAISQKY